MFQSVEKVKDKRFKQIIDILREINMTLEISLKGVKIVENSTYILLKHYITDETIKE